MKEPLKILLVEDDFNLGFVIQDNLKSEGYVVHLMKDGKEGLQQFNREDYDLCLLDVMLPKKDGFSLAEDIRKIDQEVPIVFLTAKSMTEDKISGFKSGADDYITKPFSNEEFLLRIKAILKRTGRLGTSNDQDRTFKIGDFSFDYSDFQLAHNDSVTKLTKKEADILKLLCEHQGKVLERELVANLVWGDDSYFVGRSMDVFITRLRKYLSADKKVSINNVHGVGFKLVVEGE
jgi:DNA-binding response OmpR family regulator